MVVYTGANFCDGCVCSVVSESGLSSGDGVPYRVCFYANEQNQNVGSRFYHIVKCIRASECDIDAAKNMAQAIPNWSIVKDLLAMGRITWKES